jgi:hypothetical protein
MSEGGVGLVGSSQQDYPAAPAHQGGQLGASSRLIIEMLSGGGHAAARPRGMLDRRPARGSPSRTSAATSEALLGCPRGGLRRLLRAF